MDNPEEQTILLYEFGTHSTSYDEYNYALTVYLQRAFERVMAGSELTIGDGESAYLLFNQPTADDSMLIADIVIGEEKPKTETGEKAYSINTADGSMSVKLPKNWLLDVTTADIEADIDAEYPPVQLYGGDGKIGFYPMVHEVFTSTHPVAKEDKYMFFTGGVKQATEESKHGEPVYLEFDSSTEGEDDIEVVVLSNEPEDYENDPFVRKSTPHTGDVYRVEPPKNINELLKWEAPGEMDPYVVMSGSQESGTIVVSKPRTLVHRRGDK
jgi:hypothetical protein